MTPKLYPKQFTISARRRWREEGWVDYAMVLKEETEMRQTRGYTKETRKAFAVGLEAGTYFGVYCGGSSEVSHKRFWLAEALPESNQSNRVVFKAKSADPNWISKPERMC
jgi:hypothetical protein